LFLFTLSFEAAGRLAQHFQCYFDENVSVIYVFTNENLQGWRECTMLCMGWGSSGSFESEAMIWL
jgi:hypothetical protein